MKHSLILGRNSKHKKQFIANILNQYIKLDKKVIVFNDNNFDDLEYRLNKKENLEYIKNISALSYMLDMVEHEKEEVIVFMEEYEYSRFEKDKTIKKELKEQIKRLIENNKNISFIFSSFDLAHNKYLLNIKEELKNRIIFKMSCLSIYNDFKDKKEVIKEVSKLKDSNEFYCYSIN